MVFQKKRTVIVTGATQGIGSAIAEAFVNNGDFVAIGDLNMECAIESAKRIGKLAKGYEVNIGDPASVQHFIEQVITDRGTVDVLINNASLQNIGKTEDFSLEKWNSLINVMLAGPFLLTKYVVPVMKKQQYGRIINISSVHEEMAFPFKSTYDSINDAVIRLTRTTAIDTVNEGITVNTIMPSVLKSKLSIKQLTDIYREDGIFIKQPLKSYVDSSDIPAAAIYLASDVARAVTGETLRYPEIFKLTGHIQDNSY